MNKPVDEKRANVARLPLWMYVLAWLVRTTRLAEHDLYAAPIHKSGPTATGDNSPVKERTPLELYDRVIGFYHESTFWKFQREVSKGWLWARIAIIIVGAIMVIALIAYHILEEEELYKLLAWSSAILTFSAATWIYESGFDKMVGSHFKDDNKKYGNLWRRFGKSAEFYRYLSFRNKLRDSKIGTENIEAMIALADYEKYSLTDYVKTKPSYILLYTFLAAFLAAILGGIVVNLVVGPPNGLLTNQRSDIVLSVAANIVMWVVTFCVFLLIFLPFIGFSTEQQRRYELPRFLAWYKADPPEPTTPTPGGANPPPD